MRNPFRRRRRPVPARYVRPRQSRILERHDALRAEMAVLRKESSGSLTAAGQHVVNGQATLLRRLIQPWQIRSFGYYDLLGEIKYAAQFYSRSLSNLELYAAERTDDGEIVPTENQQVKDAVARIRDPGGGGRAGLLGAYGRLMFLVGEALLFVTENDETGMEQWEMLSTDELRLNDGLYTRFMAPSLYAQQFRPAPDDEYVLTAVSKNATDEQKAAEAAKGMPEAVAYRLWKRHPRFSALADSTMQGVLELCEELVLLTQAVRARARSRLAGSGILFIDQSIGTTPLEPTPDEDPLEDPFIADLTEAMTAPIVDEGTASAVVPLVARVSVPEGMKLADLVYHLQIIDPTQVYPETGLRMECIKRIAIGLDMPSDILLGITDANHWTAWMVDEQSWKAHLQPVAQQLVEDLTSAYLGPYLKDSVKLPDWDRYLIAYDATAIINHPDRAKDAKDVHDRGALSDEALRTATGFDEDDEPSEEEKNQWAAIRLRDSSLFAYGVPSLRSGSELEPDESTLVSPDGTVTSTGDGESAAAAEKAPPEQKQEPVAEDVIGSAILVAQVEGAAQMALLRAREAAGARIRNAARRDDAVLAKIDGVAARDVAATLGSAQVRALIGGAHEATLVAAARSLVLDSLATVGVSEAEALAITDTIERHAARTLYEKRAVLNGTFPEYVRGLLAGKR